MKSLLDTHVRFAVAARSSPLFSVANAWEIMIKVQSGRRVDKIAEAIRIDRPDSVTDNRPVAHTLLACRAQRAPPAHRDLST
jgi:PIN domain nuclease of toxin-antitoxin system